ncbi:MAG: hypothetical protein GY804_09600 [Alphaproteobacteria bacterium]|nr:hypothetical protein [Alphaproteobacteria bacterium]
MSEAADEVDHVAMGRAAVDHVAMGRTTADRVAAGRKAAADLMMADNVATDRAVDNAATECAADRAVTDNAAAEDHATMDIVEAGAVGALIQEVAKEDL